MRKIIAIMLTAILVFSAFALLVSNTAKADSLPPPVITGVEPAQPWRSDTRLPFSILGSDFVSDPDPPGLKVTLKAPEPDGREYEIPRVGNEFIEVTADRINVQAGFYVEGAWKVWVTNPDGEPSNVCEFDVKAKPTAAIDEDLLDLIDQYLSDHEGKYYRDSWNITLNQYKAWIATIAWAEVRQGGYGAHSLIDLQDAGLPKSDVFNHVDQGKDFRFCTGIGPFQIDRGGGYGHRLSGDPHQVVYFEPTKAWASLIPSTDDFSSWSNWPTIKKLDPVSALETTMTYHFRRFTGNETLYDFWATAKWVWYALQEDPNLGIWGVNEEGFPWKAVTGEEWESHKGGEPKDEEGNETDLDWEVVEDQLAENATNDGNVHSYDHYAEYLGLRSWDIRAREGRDISFQGWHPTWRITPHNQHGETWYGSAYYYTFHFDSETEMGTEAWVMDNGGAEENELCYVFFREYTKTQDPMSIDDPSGCKAGETLASPALDPDLTPERDLFVPVDLVLVLDRSGSMGGVDIEGAKDAAVAVIDMLMPHDRVAVVSFASTAATNVQLTSNFEDAKTEIQKIGASGSTSFGAGLKLAVDELEARGSEDHAWAIVFMSDGYHNTSPAPDPYVEECKNLGIPIYTLGFGPYPGAVDEARLKWMAQETGGQYLFAPTIYEMENVFLMFSLEATGWPLVDEFIGAVAEGETVEAGTFGVQPSTDYVRVTLNWPGSDLDLVIERPDGSEVDLGTGSDNIYSGDEAKPEWVILLDPPAGTWTVKVYGEVVNPHADYIIWVSTYVPPTPPVITVYVDVRPGGWPNPLNIGSRGVFPVVICGTEAFNVTAVDPATVNTYIEGIGEGVSPKRWSYEDVATPYTGEAGGGHDLEGDGYLDLVFHFNTRAVVAGLGLGGHAGETIPLTILGGLREELGGTRVEGQDYVWILTPRQ